MELVQRLDDYGKPAWIVLMVLGFVLFWPIGLAILAYLIWSGRMGCWKHGRAGHWRERYRRHAERHGWGREATSGNAAFDEYREETLRRLEDEQKAFEEFLERLRHAKDKAEFDDFMNERRRQAEASDDTPGDDAPPSGGAPRSGGGGGRGKPGPEGPEARA